MSGQQRRKYELEFKRNAVLITYEFDRSAKNVVESLGISADLLYQWQKRY